MLRNFQALGALALLPCAACTHHVRVTPGYSPQVAESRGRICPNGESIAITASNDNADGDSAGTTKAGIHTFNYRFDSDPSAVLARGLAEALAKGGCGSGKDPAAKLSLRLKHLEARGLECGFVSCEGKGESMVEATLLDGAGRTLASDTFTSDATTGCGMAICNGKEASELASEVLTKVITNMVSTFAKAIANHLAAPAATGTDAAPASPVPVTPAS